MTRNVVVSGGLIQANGKEDGYYLVDISNTDSCTITGTAVSIPPDLDSRGIHVSETCKNVRAINTYTDNSGLCDMSVSIGEPVNLFPNVDFAAYGAGFANTVLTNVVKSKESEQAVPNIRTGTEAIRVQAVAGINYPDRCRVRESLSWDDYASVLSGKTITVGVWVYIPDITEYSEGGRYAAISVTDGVNPIKYSSESGKYSVVPGKWTCIRVVYDVSSVAERLTIGFLPVHGEGPASTGNEYIIVDSLFLCLGDISVAQLLVSKPAPAAVVKSYTESNVTEDREFDADTVAVAELADVVGTLIDDLRAQGIVA